MLCNNINMFNLSDTRSDIFFYSSVIFILAWKFWDYFFYTVLKPAPSRGPLNMGASVNFTGSTPLSFMDPTIHYGPLAFYVLIFKMFATP